MKILRITLSNIASLAGQHTVDFTQDPLRSAGLYAISGDTGSGKSSLLDAMCLALYGKTPRLKDSQKSLEKINNDEKQLDPRALLRRGTAEGLAEVAFIGVDGKSWTARWTVRRARKSVSGKLQAVDRTLFQGHIDPAGEGAIESGGKKTEVDAAIQEKLGLTFEQFTRAVLLAQNEFAVFLQSDDKARAEILQALTGTARFEDLSKAVFERCRIERRTMDDLKAQLHGGSILPAEERLEKETQLAEVTQQLTDIQATQKQLETEQEWHKTLATHNASVATTQADLNTATKALVESQSRKQQLQLTEQALRHAAPLKQAIKASAEKLDQCQADAKAATETLVQAEDNDQKITTEFETAESNLQKAKRQVEQLQPKLIEAAKLEESIRLQNADQEKANIALAEATTASDLANTEKQDVIKQRDALVTQENQLQKQQKEVQLYQPFADASELWIERLKQAADTNKKTKQLASELNEHQQLLNKLQEKQSKSQTNWKARSEDEALAKRQLNKAIEAAKEFDRDELVRLRNKTEECRQIWESFYTHLSSVHEHEEELSDCQGKLDECIKSIEQQDAELKQLTKTALPAAQQAVETQTASLQTVQSAISDEAVRLRTQLNNEQPCSVCGSTQHPYLAQPPSADQTAVKALQTLLQDADKKLQQLIKRHSTLQAERKANDVRRQEFESRQQQITKEIAALSFAHRDNADIQALSNLEVSEQMSTADERQSDLAVQLKQLQAKEEQATTADKAVTQARKSFEDAQQKERDTQAIATKSEQALATALADQKNRQQRFDELKTQQKNEQFPLQELFSVIPDSQIQFESDDETFQKQFIESVSLTGKVTKKLSEVETNLKRLDDKLKTIQPIVKQATRLAANRFTEANGIKEQLKTLLEKQAAIFDGRTAEAETQKVEAALAHAEKQRDLSEKNRSESQATLGKALQEVTRAEKQIKLAEQESNKAAVVFTKWRQEFNASNTVDLNESDLDQMLARDEAWLTSEREAIENFTSAVQTKKGQLETLLQQQKVHLDKRPSDQTLEQIADLQEALAKQQQAIQESKDEIQKDLNVDDAQRKNNETVQQKMVLQEKSGGPWIRLNEVIGSSDGSAFRNIAQRHTLDILLQFSNHQLSLLSGRYRLERIQNSLNLMVVDQDMADERRSIHSLSGGESFLVSLALALGLASLTSNRLKIESLFIDEGFGSLDPNTLDLAMNALVQLESQGRKVGIISHVTTMTDAIPVQIKVQKGANGASSIEVPTITPAEKKSSAASMEITQQSLFGDQNATN